MIEIRPFRPKHIQCIVPREYEREVSRVTGRDWSREFGKGPAYTLITDGIPRGAGGIVPIWAGVGEVWMYVSPWFAQHPKTSFKFCQSLLDVLIREGAFYRVQCPILASAPANKRFVEHLGFQPEGLMRRWGPEGSDYAMYSMVAPEGELLCHQHS